MTVRRENAQSRCETGMRSFEAPSVLEQYVEGASGEPTCRKGVAAPNPRWQRERCFENATAVRAQARGQPDDLVARAA
jgi:hypothetical protein